MDFKNRLKQIKFDRGVTQIALANFLGISKTVVSDYESDKSNKSPNIGHFIRIAQFFNISTDYLLGLTNNKFALRSDTIQLPLQTTYKQYVMIESLAYCVAELNLPEADFTRYSFAKRLRQLRQEKHISIRELSDKTGICIAAISGYENKFRMPSLDILFEIAKHFKTSSDYLLCLTDNPFPIHEETEPPYILELVPNLSRGQVRFIQRMANDVVKSRFDDKELTYDE